MAGRFRGVTKRGQGWQISFTLPDGQRCREMLRFPHTRTGEMEALRFRSAILHEITLGTFDYAKHFPRSPSALARSRSPGRHVLIRKALQEYLVRAEKYLARSTFLDYASRTYAHLVPEFGHLKLTELTSHDIRDWIGKQRLSNKSINNCLIPLREVYREAYDNEYLDRNPLDRIRTLPTRHREPDPFSGDEVQRILENLIQRSIDVHAYFKFAFASGLRTSELIALTCEDIDLENGRILVNKARVRGVLKAPKTTSGRRIVDLLPSAREAVVAVLRHNDPRAELFRDPRSGARWGNDQAIRKVYWYPTLDRLGIRRRNPYQTRHTFASHLLSQGANPLYVAEQMGHKDWGMIRAIYGRWVKG